MSSQTSKFEILTTSEYDFSKVKFGKEVKNVEYGFSKYKMTYPRNDVNSNDNIVKLTGLKVLGVYPPSEDHKNPKYTVMFGVSETEQELVDFSKSFDSHVLKHLFDNRSQFFGDDEMDIEDVEASYKPLFKQNENGSVTLYISFPFNNPDVKDPIRICYKQSNVDKEVIQSTDLMKKLGKGSICDVFLHLTNVYKNKSNDLKLQSTIYRRINVIEYNNLESLSSGSGSFYNAPSITDIDLSNIVMGDMNVNDKNGRSLKPRIKTGDGDKTKAITVSLNGTFRFVKNTEPNTNKLKFSVLYYPNDKEVEAFQALDEFMFKDILDNYKKYEKNGKITEKKLRDKFRGTGKKDKEGQYAMWFTVFARELEDGKFDFSGNFFKKDGKTRYTNEEVMNIFGEEYEGTLNVYFKHIWFGSLYSCKFNVGSVMVDVNSVEYDLDDDAFYDGDKSPDSNDLDNQDETDESDHEEHEQHDSEEKSGPVDSDSENSENSDSD